MEYELLFFTSVANEDRIGDIKKEVGEIITSLNGKITNDFSDIGKRKFAYPIKRQTHGFFSFCRFTLEDKENIPEINRRLQLNGNVMRHLIVRADEIGKPIAAQDAQESRPEKRRDKIIRVPAEKPAEAAGKVGMAELNDKLSQILDETPE